MFDFWYSFFFFFISFLDSVVVWLYLWVLLSKDFSTCLFHLSIIIVLVFVVFFVVSWYFVWYAHQIWFYILPSRVYVNIFLCLFWLDLNHVLKFLFGPIILHAFRLPTYWCYQMGFFWFLDNSWKEFRFFLIVWLFVNGLRFY